MKILIAIILIFLPLAALASGIEVKPAKLELSAGPGQTATAKITVGNPTADVQIFEVYADDFADSIKLNPQSFTLEAGDSKTVEVSARGAGPGIFKTEISVVGKPLSDARLVAGTGVKIPLTVSTSENPASWPQTTFVWYAAALLLAAGTFLLGRYFRHSR
jgi:hypothetical protein